MLVCRARLVEVESQFCHMLFYWALLFLSQQHQKCEKMHLYSPLPPKRKSVAAWRVSKSVKAFVPQSACFSYRRWSDLFVPQENSMDSAVSQSLQQYSMLESQKRHFPPGTVLRASQVALVVKNLPAHAGDARCGCGPGVGRILWSRKGQFTPLFLAQKIP